MWILGAVVAVAIAGGVINHLTTSSSPAPKNATERLGAPEDLGIPIRASAAEVVRRLGEPSKKQSGCWIYAVKDGAKTIGDGFGQWIDKVKYCFAEGPTGGKAVAHMSSHMMAHTVGKKHFPAGWSYIVIVGRGRSANSPGRRPTRRHL